MTVNRIIALVGGLAVVTLLVVVLDGQRFRQVPVQSPKALTPTVQPTKGFDSGLLGGFQSWSMVDVGGHGFVLPGARTVLRERVVRSLQSTASTQTMAGPPSHRFAIWLPIPLRHLSPASARVPTSIVLLPLPGEVRAALAGRIGGLAPSASMLDEQASALPGSAVAALFEPRASKRGGSVSVPAPRGDRVFGSSGVNKFRKPWFRMGRVVYTRFYPTKAASLIEGLNTKLDRIKTNPEATLWMLPVGENAAVVVLDEAGQQRSWVAYPLLDGVAGRRRGSGVSDMTVPFSSPAHDPTSSTGHQLLRTPAVNIQYGKGAYPFLGERIGLDEWFADPERGYAIILQTPASEPEIPEYEITLDIDRLNDPKVRERVEVVAIFETICDEKLVELLAAFVGVARPED